MRDGSYTAASAAAATEASVNTATGEARERGTNDGPSSSREVRGQRLRSNRLLLAEAFGERVRATLSAHGVGELEASVLDVSIHGVRLGVSFEEQASSTILLGDKLDPLTIRCDGQLVFRGAGTVARTSEGQHHVELGVALEQAAVDLGQLHQLSVRKDASQRWARALSACTSQVAPPFRAFIADLASFLDTAKSFLDREEASMASWDLHTRKAVSDELLETVARDIVERMRVAGEELGALVGELPKERETQYRAFVEAQVGRYFDCSPFVRRAKQKPLGYAGDFEMMNMLYRDHREGATLFGKAMNVYATEQPSARANINRLAYLGARIREAIEQKPEGRVRIASIGCGPAQEVHGLLSQHPELGARLDVALIDQEERAIAHCERTLAPLAARTGARIRAIKESARRLLTDRKLGQALGECDLIYSAGLFDYLADRSFRALLAVLYGALKEGGRLVVGNVASHNPDRFALEYLAEWYLHHRSQEELLSLADELVPSPRRRSVDAEPSGVNLFLLVTR